MLCDNAGMKTHVYACYLPGSACPDYVGSHNADPKPGSCALAWRFNNLRYLGQGAWIYPATGELMTMPRLNKTTPWGALLVAMSPAERLAIRVVILETVESCDRWQAEARALRALRPRFNELLPVDADTKRLKHNAYHRSYAKGYYARNPAKAVAKREADKLRSRERRAAKRACSITV